jgi:hypothetical protein
MTQDTNRPRPHVVPDDPPRNERKAKNPNSETWRTVKTVALTTLVSAAVLGSASWVWNTATRRATRAARRRQQLEQIESPYAQAPVYAAAAQQGYGWPQTNMRDVPEALRDGPRLTNTMPQAAPPPQVVVAPPSPEIIAEIRRLGQHVDKRFSNVERRFDALENPELDDDEIEDEDDDEEDAPRRRN